MRRPGQTCGAGRAGASVVLVTAQSQASRPPRVILTKQREVSSGMSCDSVLSVHPFRVFICNINEDVYDKLIKLDMTRSSTAELAESP